MLKTNCSKNNATKINPYKNNLSFEPSEALSTSSREKRAITTPFTAKTMLAKTNTNILIIWDLEFLYIHNKTFLSSILCPFLNFQFLYNSLLHNIFPLLKIKRI